MAQSAPFLLKHIFFIIPNYENSMTSSGPYSVSAPVFSLDKVEFRLWDLRQNREAIVSATQPGKVIGIVQVRPQRTNFQSNPQWVNVAWWDDDATCLCGKLGYLWEGSGETSLSNESSSSAFYIGSVLKNVAGGGQVNDNHDYFYFDAENTNRQTTGALQLDVAQMVGDDERVNRNDTTPLRTTVNYFIAQCSAEQRQFLDDDRRQEVTMQPGLYVPSFTYFPASGGVLDDRNTVLQIDMAVDKPYNIVDATTKSVFLLNTTEQQFPIDQRNIVWQLQCQISAEARGERTKQDDTPNIGLAIGIGVGGFILLLALGILCYFYIKRPGNQGAGGTNVSPASASQGSGLSAPKPGTHHVDQTCGQTSLASGQAITVPAAPTHALDNGIRYGPSSAANSQPAHELNVADMGVHYRV